jgi:hypothetical protein
MSASVEVNLLLFASANCLISGVEPAHPPGQRGGCVTIETRRAIPLDVMVGVAARDDGVWISVSRGTAHIDKSLAVQKSCR